MLFIFSTPVLIRYLWLLETVVFLHWCLIYGVLLSLVIVVILWCSVFKSSAINSIYWTKLVLIWYKELASFPLSYLRGLLVYPERTVVASLLPLPTVRFPYIERMSFESETRHESWKCSFNPVSESGRMRRIWRISTDWLWPLKKNSIVLLIKTQT
jgi:hypothetical protein